jgi:hypothetical protein
MAIGVGCFSVNEKAQFSGDFPAGNPLKGTLSEWTVIVRDGRTEELNVNEG